MAAGSTAAAGNRVGAAWSVAARVAVAGGTQRG